MSRNRCSDTLPYSVSRPAPSSTQRLTSTTASFISQSNAQFARLGNEERKKHHHPAPRGPQRPDLRAWRRPTHSLATLAGVCTSLVTALTTVSLPIQIIAPLWYCANSMNEYAFSDAALSTGVWCVAPMLLGDCWLCLPLHKNSSLHLLTAAISGHEPPSPLYRAEHDSSTA
jgi:hypothetical protein